MAAGPRASWRGHLQVGELSCAVGLFAAASSAGRTRLNMINRATGNRLSRQFVDSATGDVVESDAQVKGYEVEPGRFLTFTDDELASTAPQSEKSLPIEAFLPCDQVDTLYFDRPYYLAPSDAASVEAYAMIRHALTETSSVALARTVLFRRLRTVVIRPNPNCDNDRDRGLIATTLHYDYEVRDAAGVFDDLPEAQAGGEMIDLARHIIDTKRGTFHPSEVEDRYDAALAALIIAKAEGRKLARPRAAKDAKVVDLMEALRASAAAAAPAKPKAKARAKPAAKTAAKKPAARKAG